MLWERVGETGVYVFLGALVLFDLVLVRWLKVNAITWKKIDYVWLSFAGLGFFPAVTKIRDVAAPSLLERSRAPMDEARRALVAYLEQHRDLPCLNTPVTKATVRVNTLCAWIQFEKYGLGTGYPSGLVAAEIFPEVKGLDQESIEGKFDTVADLGTGPKSAPQRPRNDYRPKLARDYDTAAKNYQELSRRIRRSDYEEVLILLAPFALSVALALRITKVTGEITLERAKSASRAS